MRHISIAVLVLVLAAQTAVYAETVSAPTITVKAKVDDTFTLIVDLKKDVGGFPDIAPDTTMDFGSLVPNPGNGGFTLIAAEGIMAFITANSHKAPYTVDSVIAASLTSGLNTIPDGAFVLNAAYSAADNGGATNEGTASYSGTAVGTHNIYTSGGTHSMRTVQAHYTITDDPALGATSFVGLDQPVGDYLTTLVISATR